MSRFLLETNITIGVNQSNENLNISDLITVYWISNWVWKSSLLRVWHTVHADDLLFSLQACGSAATVSRWGPSLWWATFSTDSHRVSLPQTHILTLKYNSFRHKHQLPWVLLPWRCFLSGFLGGGGIDRQYTYLYVLKHLNLVMLPGA